MLGDLFYLRIETLEGQALCVTASPAGFFVICSRDPGPAAADAGGGGGGGGGGDAQPWRQHWRRRRGGIFFAGWPGVALATAAAVALVAAGFAAGVRTRSRFSVIV